METVFIVDDNDVNLTKAKQSLEGNYRVFTLPSAVKMFALMEKVIPDIILLDIEMPEMSGYDAIKKIKADPRLSAIPVIFIKGLVDENSELEGFDLGAVDYISKNFFSTQRLRKRVASQLLIARQKKELVISRKALEDHADTLEKKVREKTMEVFNLQSAVLCTVSDLVEFRDKCTGGHINRTQLYLKSLIEELMRKGLYADQTEKWDRDFFLASAQLHDVGKIAISDLILNKPAKLTPEEFEIMKSHVTVGVTVIERIMSETKEHTFLNCAMLFTSAHHEKWDGTGYPAGIKGADIPLEGRLMAVADVYDALISERPYKKPFSHEEARKIIEEGAGTHFDPVLIEAFRDVADEFDVVAKKFAD